jgi:hypothetical protein
MEEGNRVLAHAVDGKTRAEMADTDLGQGACRDNIVRAFCARFGGIVGGRQVVEVATPGIVEGSFKIIIDILGS